MLDQENLLRAVESDLASNFTWLAYADMLEEHGEPLSRVLRETIESENWSLCRCELFRKLDRRKQQLLTCDCVERLVPFYESRYPADQRPRQLIETLRRYATGKRIAAARVAVEGAFEVAAIDAEREPQRYLVALRAAQVIHRIVEMPNNACLNAAYTQAVGRFGPEVLFVAPGEINFKSEWRFAVDAEFRWQVARSLRYRFGSG